jgi:hypothetical protein
VTVGGGVAGVMEYCWCVWGGGVACVHVDDTGNLGRVGVAHLGLE